MKTEIIKYLNQQFPATVGHIPIQQMINQLELEATKKGMRRAAEQCNPLHEDYRGGSTGNARGTSGMIRQAILTAAEQLTEKDLQ